MPPESRRWTCRPRVVSEFADAIIGHDDGVSRAKDRTNQHFSSSQATSRLIELRYVSSPTAIRNWH